jgi:hypothetical protein
MLVRLIPTGQAEILGLAECLRRLFPDHTFETVPGRRDPDGRSVPFDGFTSGRLKSPDDVGSRLPRLIQQLAADVHPGRDGKPADLAVLIDDLELENVDQPHLVVDVVREAARRHLHLLSQHKNADYVRRVAEALRERASFHLAVPMVEAWFFADAGAFLPLGVPASQLPPRLKLGVDPEAFETDDPSFSADDASHCLALIARNASNSRAKPKQAPWMLKLRDDLPAYRRERHPKAYLNWLCRTPSDERGSTYRESIHGARALAGLDWQSVLASPSHYSFARALVQDLAEKLGPPALSLPPGDECPLLARSKAPPARVLRNL